MSFGPFSDPFFSGTASSASETAPSLYTVALAGQGLFIDLKQYERKTVEVMRDQSDQSKEVGEQSLNPKGTWRRSQESWHLGAGQRFLDAEDSSRLRFRSSKGMDPWTRGALKLHKDTANRRASAQTQQHCVSVQGYLYLAQGAAVYFTADPSVASPTWTTVTGVGAGAVTSMTTNGEKIWWAQGADIYQTNRGDAAATVFSTQNADLVGYANGRLLCADSQTLYELASTGVATSLFAHPYTTFRWSFISSGQRCIYVGGNHGEQGEIYRIDLAEGTTGLGAPTSAAAWPDGEQIYAFNSYVGGVLLGTSRGIRMAVASDDGSLNYGAVIRTTVAVKALEPQDEFVWFAWTNYDGVSSGLGRVNLTTFTESLIPAWASDLMATAQGEVMSIATFAGKRYFTVSGVGLFGEDTTLVATGTIDLGELRYGTTERKITNSIDLRYEPLAGTVTSYQSLDGRAFEEIAGETLPGTTGSEDPHSLRSQYAERLEIRLVFARDATVTTTGPTLIRWTTRALIVPRRVEEILLPVLMFERVENEQGDGVYIEQNTIELWNFLKELEAAGAPIVYQEGDQAWTAVVSQISLKPTSWTGVPEKNWLNGIAFVLLQTLD